MKSLRFSLDAVWFLCLTAGDDLNGNVGVCDILSSSLSCFFFSFYTFENLGPVELVELFSYLLGEISDIAGKFFIVVSSYCLNPQKQDFLPIEVRYENQY